MAVDVDFRHCRPGVGGYSFDCRLHHLTGTTPVGVTVNEHHVVFGDNLVEMCLPVYLDWLCGCPCPALACVPLAEFVLEFLAFLFPNPLAFTVRVAHVSVYGVDAQNGYPVGHRRSRTDSASPAPATSPPTGRLKYNCYKIDDTPAAPSPQRAQRGRGGSRNVSVSVTTTMNEKVSNNLFEHVPDALVVHDPETGEILDANEAYLAMHGYDHEELVGKTVEQISADDPAYSAERAAERIHQARDEGDIKFEWVNKRKSGETFPVEVHLTLLPVDGEDRVLASVRDITERRERQVELQRQNERLEQFASVLGHDLRNPLNVAQLRLQQVDEDVEPVQENLARMEGIIDDVLALAREGQTVDEPEERALSTIAHTAWDQVETGRGSLIVEDNCSIEVDPGRCQQLFENLFRNAVEHGSTSPDSQTRQDAVEHGSTSSRTASDDAVEHAGPEVTVRVGCAQDGFYVEDDGPGITADDCREVFETGYTTTDGGTGLGLSIVQAIAEAHGWEIDVTESSDGGARFVFAPHTAEQLPECRT